MKGAQGHHNSKTRPEIQLRNCICQSMSISRNSAISWRGFAPEGYEDGEGGFGTITFDLETRLIRVEHNWYETVSHPDKFREI